MHEYVGLKICLEYHILEGYTKEHEERREVLISA